MDRYAIIRLEVLPDTDRAGIAELHVVLGGIEHTATVDRSFADNPTEGVRGTLFGKIIGDSIVRHLVDTSVFKAVRLAESVRQLDEAQEG